MSRERTDENFLEAMEVLGVPRWQRYVMWPAVRLGGGSACASGSSTGASAWPHGMPSTGAVRSGAK